MKGKQKRSRKCLVEGKEVDLAQCEGKSEDSKMCMSKDCGKLVNVDVSCPTKIPFNNDLQNEASAAYKEFSAKIIAAFEGILNALATQNKCKMRIVRVIFYISMRKRRRTREGDGPMAQTKIEVEFDYTESTQDDFDSNKDALATGTTNSVTTKIKSGDIEVIDKDAMPMVEAVDKWNEWEVDGECSATCGGGKQEFIRTCSNVGISPNCKGDSSKQEDCNSQACDNDGSFEDGAYTPCPSNKCWDYDSENFECTLKPGCATVTCGATSIEMGFLPGVFGNGDETSGISPAGFAAGKLTVNDIEMDGFVLNCDLGGCGMLYDLTGDKYVY